MTRDDEILKRLDALSTDLATVKKTMATKADLESFATKAEIPTVEQIRAVVGDEVSSKLDVRLQPLYEKIDALRRDTTDEANALALKDAKTDGRLTAIRRSLHNHDVRLVVLEKHVGVASHSIVRP